MKNVFTVLILFVFATSSYNQTLTRVTPSDIEKWKNAGDLAAEVVDWEIEKELTSMITGKKADERMMYDSLYSVFIYYNKVDKSVSEYVNNAKISSDMKSRLKLYHPYFMMGGVYYFEAREYSHAADFFEAYCEIPNFNMFEEKFISDDNAAVKEQEKQNQISRYYAVVAAISANDDLRAIISLKKLALETYIPNDKFKESDIYELLAAEHQKVGDEKNFLHTLRLGLKKFPQNIYFTTNIVNHYIMKGDLDDAILYLDGLIKENPSQYCEYVGVKGNIYAHKKDYKNAEKSFSDALKKAPDCERALDGLALTYILNAQDLKDSSTETLTKNDWIELNNEAEELYKKAFPLLEKLKKIYLKKENSVEDLKSVLVKLQNVYYNLNMVEEYEQATKELERFY